MSRVSQAEAWRRVRNVLEISDLVLEVIDSRDPWRLGIGGLRSY